MLIINFSYSSADFLTCKNKFEAKKCFVLDMSGALTELNDFKIVKASDLDKDFTILNEATKQMIETIANVSLLPVNKKNQVRDIELQGLNLYWQTSFSEKHPARSFLIKLFFLKGVLESKLIPFTFENVYIIFPSIYSSVYSASIKKYFSANHSIKKVEFNNQLDKTFFAGFRTFLKKVNSNFTQSSDFRNRLNRINNSTNNKPFYNYIITPFPGTWLEKEQEDRVLGKIQSYYNEPQNTYIPLFSDLNSEITWPAKWDKTYLHYLPGKSQLRSHQLASILCFKKINELKKVNFNGIDFLDEHVLIYEFQKVIFEQNNVFFNFLWIKNFSSSVKSKINIFYQDEFYPTGGRFISQAVNRSANSNVTACGFEHALIYDGQSVYNLTKKELECTKPFNGLPKPKKFILWGDHFKKVVNKNNAFKDEELIVAGNLNYIFNAEKYSNLKTTNSVPVILWCTATDQITKTQFEILLPFLRTLSDYRLVIRMYPSYNIKDHITKLADEEVLKKIIFRNNDDIFEAIFRADVILSITASSIFLDALALNKMVFLFPVEGYYVARVHSNNIRIINSVTELTSAYNALLSGKYSEKFLASQDLLHMDSGVWKKILSPN